MHVIIVCHREMGRERDEMHQAGSREDFKLFGLFLCVNYGNVYFTYFFKCER